MLFSAPEKYFSFKLGSRSEASKGPGDFWSFPLPKDCACSVRTAWPLLPRTDQSSSEGSKPHLCCPGTSPSAGAPLEELNSWLRPLQGSLRNQDGERKFMQFDEGRNLFWVSSYFDPEFRIFLYV
ncbi:hypothetical protein E2320_001294 [Naja naja]|nr:hypothetical protein E2320_001294 [Naja naja]